MKVMRAHTPTKIPRPPKPLRACPTSKAKPIAFPYFAKLSTFKENLKNLQSKLEQCASNIPLPSQSQYDTLIGVYQLIMTTDLGDLASVISSGINKMYAAFVGKKVPKNLEGIYSQFSTYLFNIQQMLLFVAPLSKDEVPKSDRIIPTRPTHIHTDTEKTVICRICEKPVCIDMIEEHTENCLRAYQSESQIVRCNERLMAIREYLANSYLRIKWPGDADTDIGFVYSILHITIILDAIIRVETGHPDSPGELEYLIGQLSLFIQNDTRIEVLNSVTTALNETYSKKHHVVATCTSIDIVKKTLTCEAQRVPMNITIADFEFIKRISRGAFARVFLARKKATGDIYAIKVQSRSDARAKNQNKRLLAEKDILLNSHNPYIVNFYYSIVGANNFYIVMEYLPGGDLYSLLQKLGCIDEASARTYAFQIAKALDRLHADNIIHRDLKPDNVLVAADGRLKLTDFGLSFLGVVDRRISGEDAVAQSASLVGTPNYIAPEVMMRQPHSFPVDFWSLGTVVYELLTGAPPFAAETEAELRMLITAGAYEKLDPNEFSPECCDFVDQLLQVDPSKRLSAPAIFSHPWLAGLDEEHLEAPFVPQLTSSVDTEYFEVRYDFEDGADESIVEDVEFARKPPMVTSVSCGDADSLFRSVSMSQLARANIEAASHARRQSLTTEQLHFGEKIREAKDLRVAQSQHL